MFNILDMIRIDFPLDFVPLFGFNLDTGTGIFVIAGAIAVCLDFFVNVASQYKYAIRI
ncbi:MAG: hypothetical protein RIG77_20245 [Cyclobacteriaceae bacterium]